MKPKWPRYKIKYSFSPFLKHCSLELDILCHSHLSPCKLTLIDCRAWLSSWVIVMWHSVNHWSLNEQVSEWQQKKMGLYSYKQRLEIMLHCLLSNWEMAEKLLKFMDQRIRETLGEVNIMLCLPQPPHASGGQPRVNESPTLHGCVLEKSTCHSGEKNRI